MTSVVLFDAESCCSTADDDGVGARGVAEFVAASKWMADQGVTAQRFTLSSAPEEFVANAEVAQLLATSGASALPALVVDGEMKASGRYPSTEELSAWTGLSAPGQAAADAQGEACCAPTPVVQAEAACCATPAAAAEVVS